MPRCGGVTRGARTCKRARLTLLGDAANSGTGLPAIFVREEGPGGRQHEHAEKLNGRQIQLLPHQAILINSKQ